MAPTGVHGLLGLLIASKLDRKHSYTRMGLVTGSVMPDLDLLGSVLIFIMTADTELTLAFHRSVTHSLIVIGLILLIGFLGNLKYESVSSIYFPFILGFVVGVLLHITLDLIYFDGVTLFWPLQPLDDRIYILPFTYNDLSPNYNSLSAKIIGTIDGHAELLFYIVFAYLANRYHTNQEITLGWSSRRFKIYNWPKKLTWFSIFLIFEMLFFLGLAIFSITWPSLDRDAFFILLYIPLTPVYLLSGLLPLIMRETIFHLGTDKGQ
ncbi:MAG: metal-dependent hydrolase [Candidatus Heimdallarchaeota archaeon]|nr:MAG: metal-dependent hydrolase [Candidatus Heimdallarchaeota archaeon]